MLDSPTASETIAAAHAHLAEALAYLDAHGIVVMLDGDPLRYRIDGRAVTEGELVALATRICRRGRGWCSERATR